MYIYTYILVRNVNWHYLYRKPLKFLTYNFYGLSFQIQSSCIYLTLFLKQVYNYLLFYYKLPGTSLQYSSISNWLWIQSTPFINFKILSGVHLPLIPSDMIRAWNISIVKFGNDVSTSLCNPAWLSFNLEKNQIS